jgi:hypothetical protein
MILFAVGPDEIPPTCPYILTHFGATRPMFDRGFWLSRFYDEHKTDLPLLARITSTVASVARHIKLSSGRHDYLYDDDDDGGGAPQTTFARPTTTRGLHVAPSGKPGNVGGSIVVTTTLLAAFVASGVREMQGGVGFMGAQHALTWQMFNAALLEKARVTVESSVSATGACNALIDANSAPGQRACCCLPTGVR